MAQHRPQKLEGEHQHKQPGRQHKMRQQPQTEKLTHVGSGKLAGKVALITGGDSGIGRAVAVAFAKEGANVAIGYLDEDKDAKATKKEVESHGQQCLAVAGDIGDPEFCANLVQQTVDTFGQLDVIVNNAAEQHVREDIEEISPQDLERTFKTNIFSMFYIVESAMPYLKEGSAIINTTSVVAYVGNPNLLDYTTTKGAIVAFTRGYLTRLLAKAFG